MDGYRGIPLKSEVGLVGAFIAVAWAQAAQLKLLGEENMWCSGRHKTRWGGSSYDKVES
jgi:hypothetical protein